MVVQVDTIITPSVADLPVIDGVVEKASEVIAIHPYMPMSNRLVIINDFVLANPEVSFVVGTSVTLPEDQKVLQSYYI